MRYALISDIHANWQAWQAVLADLQTAGVDGVICLGDIVGYGPQPARVLESVYEASDLFVLGNHDAVICGRFDSECFNDDAKIIIDWTGQQLNTSAVDFFNQVPMMVMADEFACSHAEFAIPERFDYIYDPPEALESLEATNQPLLFVGHTHYPGTIQQSADGQLGYYKPQDFSLQPDARYVVNVGSVGDPRNGDIRASYCIYDLDHNAVEFRNVPFDIESYRQEIARAGIPTKPILFDYADRLIDAAAQPESAKVREFHVDEEVARAAASEVNVGRISDAGIHHRGKIQISAGSIGDGAAFRSSQAAKSRAAHAAKQNRKQNISIVLVGTLLIFLVGIGAYLFLNMRNNTAPASPPDAAQAVPMPPAATDPTPGTTKPLAATPRPNGWQPPPGFAAYWSFDEGSGKLVNDQSANGILLNTSGTDWVTDGVRGKAMRFKGNASFAEATNSDLFNFDWKDPFTISLWVRPSKEGTLFAKLNPDHHRGYYCKLDRGVFQFRLMAHFPTDNRIKTYMITKAASLKGPNGWTHLAIAYDGSVKEAGVRFFVNGYEEAKAPQLDKLAGSITVAQNFMIGNRFKKDLGFHGEIDEFLIYPHVLTTREIKRLADFHALNAAPPPAPADAAQLAERFAHVEDQLADSSIGLSTAIAGLERLHLQASDDPIREQITEKLEQLKGQRDLAITEVLNGLRARTDKLAEQGKYQEAAQLYRNYQEAYAKETETDRSRLAAPLEQQHHTITLGAQQRQQKDLLVIQHFESNMIDWLLRQQYEEAFAAFTDNQQEFPRLAEHPRYQKLSQELAGLQASHEKILQSFESQKGRDIKIQVSNKSATVRCEGIKQGQLQVRRKKGQDYGDVQTLKLRYLSTADRLRRLGTDNSSGAQLLRGIFRVHEGNKDEAAQLFDQSRLQFGAQLKAALPRLDQQHHEDRALATLSQMKKALGIDPRSKDAQAMQARIYQRNITKAFIQRVQQQVERFQASYGETKVYKDNKPFFDLLGSLSPLIRFKPETNTSGNYALAPTSISGNKKEMRDVSNKRVNLTVHGEPGFHRTEFGELFYFDGAKSYLSSVGKSTIRGNAPFTITFWNKPERKATNSTLIMLGKRGKSKELEWLTFGYVNYRHEMQIPGFPLAAQKPEVTYDTWQFNILRYDPPNLAWRVNNNPPLQAQVPQPMKLLDSLRIGVGADSANNLAYPYKGYIKDVFIYDRALEPAVIDKMLDQLK